MPIIGKTQQFRRKMKKVAYIFVIFLLFFAYPLCILYLMIFVVGRQWIIVSFPFIKEYSDLKTIKNVQIRQRSWPRLKITPIM